MKKISKRTFATVLIGFCLLSTTEIVQCKEHGKYIYCVTIAVQHGETENPPVKYDLPPVKPHKKIKQN